MSQYTTAQLNAYEEYKKSAPELRPGHYIYLVIAPDGYISVNEGKLDPNGTFPIWRPAYTKEYLVAYRARPPQT